jgi:WhiB family redox-sensing transcriptional regulator
MPEEIFFGVESVRRGPILSLGVLRHAREVCDQCPVQRECLTHALTLPEQYGVWGGTSGNEREKMRRRLDSGMSVTTVVSNYLENP